MLNKQLQNQPPTSNTNQPKEIIPDPWSEKTSPETTSSATPVWKPVIEPHPLIAGEEKAKVFNLPAPRTTIDHSAVQVLLEDEIKIKGNGKLQEHIQQALGLLAWMATVTPEYAT
ncbi:MAG: hypothetical protein QNJ63_24985 [Calothrix sp. MO_192.B10]|nr:hypothetical protein [Calothrix sp. MO_192.B10]